MKIQRVKSGDTITICRPAGGGTSEARIEYWKVVSVYDNFVLCERNGIRESFTRGELIQLGYEPIKKPDRSLRDGIGYTKRKRMIPEERYGKI